LKSCYGRTEFHHCPGITGRELLVKRDFRNLRMNQLARALSAFDTVKQEPRPSRGCLRVIRQGLGLTLENVGVQLRQSRRNLKRQKPTTASHLKAYGALPPQWTANWCMRSFPSPAPSPTWPNGARAEATRDVLDVEQTMALENQAPGNVDELIEQETKRRLRHGARFPTSTVLRGMLPFAPMMPRN
jgi:hypothetical protein